MTGPLHGVQGVERGKELDGACQIQEDDVQSVFGRDNLHSFCVLNGARLDSDMITARIGGELGSEVRGVGCWKYKLDVVPKKFGYVIQYSPCDSCERSS
jgi:hypothetical protein